jgi:hypothetical protein
LSSIVEVNQYKYCSHSAQFQFRTGVSAILAMCFFVVYQVAGVVEGSTAVVTFEWLHSRVSVEVHLESLSSCKFFPAHFANKLSLIGVSFGVTVTISDA